MMTPPSEPPSTWIDTVSFVALSFFSGYLLTVIYYWIRDLFTPEKKP